MNGRKAVHVVLLAVLFPMCVAVECEDPPTVLHADVSLQNFTRPYLNGTVIHYTCHYGYALNSTDDPSAVCIIENLTQGWHLSHFSCEPACESVPDIPHGTLKLDGREPPFFNGDSVVYACDPGFIGEVVPPKIICKNSSWIVPQEACRARSCGYPGDIENSQRIGNAFNFPNNVTYVCNEGYQLKGMATIFCSTSGVWRPSHLPSCEAVVCPLLSHPEHGKVITSDRRYKAVATYECSRNYHLKGSAQRVCQADATWDGSVPSCVEITCPNPGPLPNGRILPAKPIYKAGDVVVFSCNEGGKTEASKCLEDGTWKLPPPLCEAKSTHSPGTFERTSDYVDLKKTTVKPVTVPGFGSESSSCDDPGDIRNGKKVITGFTPNSNVTYSCEDGYEIRGQRILVCLPDGKWNVEKLPLCIKPIPVTTIVGVVGGVILLVVVGVIGYFYYRWREKKVRGYGKKSKALTADAADLEEITGLEKEKKPIPVTVL